MFGNIVKFTASEPAHWMHRDPQLFSPKEVQNSCGRFAQKLLGIYFVCFLGAYEHDRFDSYACRSPFEGWTSAGGVREVSALQFVTSCRLS
jgi:hypothetical protein